MNPFRKKSQTDPELRVSPEDAAPGLTQPPDPRGSGSPHAAADSWPDTVVAAPSTSPPISSHPPTKPTPKSPPPPVAPRRRRSQIAPKRHPTPEPPPVADPFNPNPDTASSDSDTSQPLPPPSLPPPRDTPRSISPSNPFQRRSLDMSDLRPVTTGIQQKPGRQSLDVDAFKRLMLTGQATPDSSSTDTSSVSRQSIFEPILETETIDPSETPRTSHELEDEDGGRAKTRPKPPPPKPRSRGASGGKSPIAASVTLSIPSSPPPKPPVGRPASIRSLNQLDKPSLPPPPPPPLLSPTSPHPPLVSSTSPMSSPPPSPAPSISKRTAPSPPLSRRHSVQKPNPLIADLEHPSTPGKMKPPPPPMRRMKSVSTRPHERTKSLVISALPPPPPPPRSRSSTIGVGTEDICSVQVELSSNPASPVGGEVVAGIQGVEVKDEGDILSDLQKLQREVDELRGKYEGRKSVNVE